MMTHTRQYTDYLQSYTWECCRRRALIRAGNQCERCGRTDVVLQVHHLSYERLGHERETDLKVVCVPCHAIEDALYREETRYQRGLDTYVSKRYGEDVEITEEMVEAYDDWVERRADEW